MKTLSKLGTLVLIAITALASCKKDEHQLNMNVNAVTTLSAPADQASFSLSPGGGNVTFQWQATSTPDPVLYEVAFAKTGGDFSHPVYKVLSDGGGVQAQATISQDTLNKIASLAGIASSATGTMKWAVLVSLATNNKVSAQTHSITVTRPAGFAVLPAAVYLSGTATEGGSIQMKQVSNGVFESYTSLQPGTYHFSDKPDGSGNNYYIDDKGVLQLGTGSTTVSAAKKAYRIDLNFTVATTKITRIDSVGLYMSAYNTDIGTLNYIGNGTWENPKIPVTFFQFSWGRDQRYKFILHTDAGLEYWGSANVDNVDPAGQPASYFYVVPASNDQWSNTYKFPAAADMHNVKVDLYFQATGPYTHTATAFN
ncbi:MAG: SusE domain-containing protein [Bacteroidetes bacterium]|nr:SusE domain-containing protein [Bacteroidota bacterium]